jgi:hypothetical protein
MFFPELIALYDNDYDVMVTAIPCNMSQAVNLLTCIQDVTSSNFGLQCNSTARQFNTWSISLKVAVRISVPLRRRVAKGRLLASSCLSVPL